MKNRRTIAIGDKLKDPEGVIWTVVGKASPGGDKGFMLDSKDKFEILPAWLVENWIRVW